MILFAVRLVIISPAYCTAAPASRSKKTRDERTGRKEMHNMAAPEAVRGEISARGGQAQSGPSRFAGSYGVGRLAEIVVLFLTETDNMK
jgi:hypothetical protein